MTPSFLLRGALIAGLALPLALAAGCNSAAHQKEAKRVEVIVTTPIADEVIDPQDFTGRLDAFYTVDIRARVTGYVNEAPFKEGDLVEKGKLLFQIDPQTYQADFDLADANLHLAEADVKLQQDNLTRARLAFEKRGISIEEYQTVQATYAKSQATAIAAQSARAKAKLYLDYTRVTAPHSGRVSRRNVDPGNEVNADTTVLTTLVTESPVYLYFDVDERTYLDLTAGAALVTSSGLSPQLQSKVLMRLANEENFTRVGTVNFVDNRINASTGTIRMRAEFDNARHELTPGLFARVRMPTSKAYKALLIPDEAIQTDQGKKFVYLVNNNNEVVYLGGDNLVLGPAVGKLRVVKIIDKGLTENDQVVVVGMQRIKPKQVVDVQHQAPPQRPRSLLDQLNPRKEEKDK
jgi:RND family efflux transporter MFP subunit